jgi:hypothetical protein
LVHCSICLAVLHIVLQKARVLLGAGEHHGAATQNSDDCGGDLRAGRCLRCQRRGRGRRRAASVEDRHPPGHRRAPVGRLRRRVAGPSRPGGEPYPTRAVP